MREKKKKKNAFNCTSRQLIFDECAKHFPEPLPWVTSCYSARPVLRHSLGTLTSDVGVQQGDPLGPLLFALALHRFVSAISASVPLIFHSWYLDDGVFCGTLSSVRQVVKLLQAATPVSGLLVKLDKCEAFSRNSLDTLNDDIRKSAVPNMEILGAPIGSSEFCRDFASRKRDKACELLRALPQLQNPQIALSILRRCAGFCRLAHIARATPVQSTVAALASFDDDMRRTLDESAAIESTDLAWQQAQLSTRRGGLGLRSVAQHAGAAFIASYTASCTEPSAHLHEAVLHLNERVAPDDRLGEVQLSGDRLLRQHELSERIDAASASAILLAEHLYSGQLFGCRTLLHRCDAADWLRVVPSPGLGLASRAQRNERSAREVVARSAAEQYQYCLIPSTPHSTPLDPLGHHALTCRKNGDVVIRHNRLRDLLHESCSRALLRPQLERGNCGSQRTKPTVPLSPADICIPAMDARTTRSSRRYRRASAQS